MAAVTGFSELKNELILQFGQTDIDFRSMGFTNLAFESNDSGDLDLEILTNKDSKNSENDEVWAGKEDPTWVWIGLEQSQVRERSLFTAGGGGGRGK